MPACRCPLWLKSATRGVPPCPGSEFTLAQYSCNCPLFPCSLLLGVLRCCAVGATLAVSYSPLPTLHRLSSLLLGDSQVPDSSGRRLAQDCQCLNPPVFLRGWLPLFPLFCSSSLFVSPFLSVGLSWAVRPLPPPCPLGSYFPRCFLRPLVASLVVCLPCVVSYTCLPGFFLVVCLD